MLAAAAIGALGAASNSQASTISNTVAAHHKHGAHAVKSSFETPASHALGNNSTKTAGISKDFLATMKSVASS
jgi:hypothetical protein